MMSIAGELANMIDMVHGRVQGDLRAFGPVGGPARHHHPRVEWRTNYSVALDDGADLFVTILAIAGSDSSAIFVARQHRAVELLKRLPKTLVCQVGKIKEMRRCCCPGLFPACPLLPCGFGPRTARGHDSIPGHSTIDQGVHRV
jgi:hypothetical protein